MITEFEEGKYYVWDCKDKRIENNPSSIWFNTNMMNWFDRKPRKCHIKYDRTQASFDNLVDHDIWDYSKAMYYFKEYIPVRQEEMDI